MRTTSEAAHEGVRLLLVANVLEPKEWLPGWLDRILPRVQLD